MSAPEITVEFFGMARRLAGCAAVSVRAGTADVAISQAIHRHPALHELRATPASLSARFLLSCNGGPFHRDLKFALNPGDRLLVLSADAGG